MSLTELVLGDNQLCGEIPASLKNMTQLYDVDNLNGEGIDIKNNFLFTNDAELDTFLIEKGGAWKSSQGTPTSCPSDFPWTMFLPAIIK